MGCTLAFSAVTKPGYRLVYGLAEILTVGLGLTFTLVVADVAEQPCALFTTTL